MPDLRKRSISVRAGRAVAVVDAGMASGSDEFRAFPTQFANDLVRSVRTQLHAQRVMLILETPDGLRVKASHLPNGEKTSSLLLAITHWLDTARETRVCTLRHGPHGVAHPAQRSCLVAPLVLAHEVLGYLYADIEGAVGRFHESDREALMTLVSRATATLGDRSVIKLKFHTVK